MRAHLSAISSAHSWSIALLVFAGLGTTCLFAADNQPDKPNIVYLLTDQWRASALGYAGDPNVKTPNLDRLAGQGLNFPNAVSVIPVCTPHRAAFMTGRYPTTTGMFLNDAHLPDDELCLAEIFKAAGYTTAMIGKWHLDGQGRTAYIPPERRQGFEYWKAAECEHNYNHSHYYEGTSNVKKYWDGYDAYAQTKDAQQYIRDHAGKKQPFVLVLAYGTPHFPHGSAPEELKKLYQPKDLKLEANVAPDEEAAARKELQGYYAHCTALDTCVGNLMKTLDETGLASSTILVFSADHGEMMGSHGLPPTMKQAFWNEAATVPFLLRYPAGLGDKGRVVRMPITTPDVLPTLLGLAGIAIPPSIEGDDLSPLLRKGQEDPTRAALYMNVAPFDKRRPLEEYRALRTNRYTYVQALSGPKYLFDNEKDPLQLNNLLSNPEQAGLVADFVQQMKARLAKNKDDFKSAADSIALWGYQVANHGSIPYKETGETKPQTPKRQY